MTAKAPLSLAIAAIGAAVMAALAFGVLLPPDYPFIGARLYDLYAQALMHGHFDLPLRALRLEGHYTPDGTGYLYNGLGPLLTRMPFLPFVSLPTWWLSPLTIWLWSVIGNACYHRAFVLALSRAGERVGGIPTLVHALLAIAVWFGAPGILLVANCSLFYEPVAMAYGLGGGFVLLIAMLWLGMTTLRRAIVPLALIAGLVLHARPHLAVGYYAGVCLLAARLVWGGKVRDWARAIAAMLVLGVFGVVLLASNALRFHDVTVMHGTFEKSPVQYGMIYWGAEAADGWRARGFEEHGQFNAGRILPNALVYVASPPDGSLTDPLVKRIEAFNRDFASEIGMVRIEKPKGGTLFLWPLWMLLMAIGLFQKPLWRMPGIAGLVSVAIGSGLLLAYATITLRYHADLWPAIALPALYGIGPFAGWLLAPGRGRVAARIAAIALLYAGVGVSIMIAVRSRPLLQQAVGTLSEPWSDAHCLELTARKGFSAERGRELCDIPEEEATP